MMVTMIVALLIAALFVAAFVLIPILFRVVVPQNEVHSVQSSSQTISYGREMEAGNSYYKWPSWIPKIGVVATVLPVSVFKLDLENYEAYDKGRLPFALDISAFFRVNDPNLAAQRVSSIQLLNEQLRSILQGACRTILASKEIEEILEGRAEFGEAFTKEVMEQLKAWGVAPVKNLEIMDIRDSSGSSVIKNIMEKKKSLIERQSRVEVAENMKVAQIAEIEAKREAEMSMQQAHQAIGIRTAEKEREVGIAREQSAQQVAEQNKVTQEKNIEVVRVQEVGNAEIRRATQVIAAEEKKQTDVIRAEGDKTRVILQAEATLETERRVAEAVKVNGEARADAERLLLLAPVEAQITLAKEIGENAGYQTYLIQLRNIEATQTIGVAQADALKAADIKVISNAGTVDAGISGISDIFSAKGGQGLAALMEGLSQTSAGAALIEKLTTK